jgi:hypothetical protein
MQPTQRNPSRLLDVICLGRLGADLYAPQIGARLEDAASFAKYKAERHQEGRSSLQPAPTLDGKLPAAHYANDSGLLMLPDSVVTSVSLPLRKQSRDSAAS